MLKKQPGFDFYYDFFCNYALSFLNTNDYEKSFTCDFYGCVYFYG
jgi:hypothetical protein